MEFTCPHCGKTFEQKIREASDSPKAKEASRRNLEAGGYNRKASPEDLRTVFQEREAWAWQDFVAAVQRKTGAVYSRTQAFALLQKLKSKYKHVAKWQKKHAGQPVKFVGGLDPAAKDTPPLVKNNRPTKVSSVARVKKTAK